MHIDQLKHNRKKIIKNKGLNDRQLKRLDGQ